MAARRSSRSPLAMLVLVLCLGRVPALPLLEAENPSAAGAVSSPGASCPPNTKADAQGRHCICREGDSCSGPLCRNARYFEAEEMHVVHGFMADCGVGCSCESESPLWAPETALPPGADPNLVIVLGVGSGRCGTHSLTALLGAQAESFVTHERTKGGRQCKGMSWPGPDFPADAAERTRRVREQLSYYINRKPGKTLVGDVGHFHLAYAEEYLREDQRVRIVGLKRPREDTLNSWLRWWASHHKSHRFPFLMRADYAKTQYKSQAWDSCFPSYKFDNLDTLSQREGIERHYDHYYSLLESLVAKYPDRVAMYSTYEVLNDQTVCESQMFPFLNVKKPYNFQSYKRAKTSHRTVHDAADREGPGNAAADTALDTDAAARAEADAYGGDEMTDDDPTMHRAKDGELVGGEVRRADDEVLLRSAPEAPAEADPGAGGWSEGPGHV